MSNGFVQVGSCPKCGAPIYAPLIWHGTTPPPSEYTCMCYREQQKIITTTTEGD
mgnify:CR=1 FL=1